MANAVFQLFKIMVKKVAFVGFMGGDRPIRPLGSAPDRRPLYLMSRSYWNLSCTLRLCISETLVCPSILQPTNGRFRFLGPERPDSLIPGTVITFTCDPGFLMQGEVTIRCNVNGTWSGVTPKCVGEPRIFTCVTCHQLTAARNWVADIKNCTRVTEH